MTNDEIKAFVLASLEIAHARYQQREAFGWLVLCFERDLISEGEDEGFVGTYGPFASPEEALVQCGKHDATSEDGFTNVVIPLYPPVAWKDEQ